MTVSRYCLQSYRNIGLKYPTLFPADNTMTDVKILRPYVIQSGKNGSRNGWRRRLFCIDSKPIEACRFARSRRCNMGKKDFEKVPSIGYFPSQSIYYYGYKTHAVCGLSGIIHSFDLTKASVHDIHYLKDVKVDYSNSCFHAQCFIIPTANGIRLSEASIIPASRTPPLESK